MDFDRFLLQLKTGEHNDETCFYFTDDPEERERYLGYISQYERPYWVGLCDIPDGCESKTAEELVNAKIFDGKSLSERWDKVVICEIAGLSFDYWKEIHLHD